MKILILMSVILYSVNSFACPQLQGRYNKCFSEVRKFNGEYIIDQYQENDFDVYKIEFNNDETGLNQQDTFKTNGQIESRKQSFPSVGITVKIEARSYCDKDVVVSKGDAYYFGIKVGSFVSKIFVENNHLKSHIDGTTLGKVIHKRIDCELI